jgi:tetratricopeptide (TPR) repeat protein
MKFVCPVCKTAGDIPEEYSVQPATQTTCQKCGTSLSIEHETGRVQTLATERNQPAGKESPGFRSKDESSSVSSMGSQNKGRKDYLAMGVFAAVLFALIITGVYFSFNIDRGALNQPLQKISKLFDEVSLYGKSILRQFQKDRQPKNQQARQAQKHVRKGYEHYKENRLEKALEELSQAIETHPENPEAYFWRARTFIRQGQYDNAIADLNAVVNLNPRYNAAYDNLGWLFMRRNKYDESLFNLNKSIELKPDNGWAHYMRGRVFFNKGDFQKAVEDAKTACKLGYKDGCRDAKRYEAKLTENG